MDSKIKLLRFCDRVQSIINVDSKSFYGFMPPIIADIDLVGGFCNVDCEWCCQRKTREEERKVFMPVETMERMGSFCKEWGVKSWRIAGNSEPTLNPNIDCLLKSGHKNGIDMGLITNGVLLDRVKNLNLLDWLGISLDASTAKTWSRLKHSPEENFYKIIENVRGIRRDIPNLEITFKFIRWSEDTDLSRKDFSNKKREIIGERNNYADAEILPYLAKELGVKYIIHDAFSRKPKYRFEVCRATPFYATFCADHKFSICCDVRNDYLLTDDYTRNDWKELYDLWGSKKHKDIITSINPKRCKFCSKEYLNDIMENIILDGKHTKEYQVNFI